MASTTSTTANDSLFGFPRDELVEDFRLTCVSRALDDREMA